MMNYDLILNGAEELPVDYVKGKFALYGMNISDEFASFYAKLNGGCGEIRKIHLDIWHIIGIFSLNKIYRVKDNIDNIVIFGSDGNQTALGYDYVKSEYIIVPFIGMGFLIPPEYAGNTYEEFINHISKRLYC